MYIGIYLVGQKYGGPEEGGWYYSYGELVRTIHVHNPMKYESSEKAKQMAHRMNRLFMFRRWKYCLRNEPLRYEARTYSHLPPVSFPQNRPYYC